MYSVIRYFLAILFLNMVAIVAYAGGPEPAPISSSGFYLRVDAGAGQLTRGSTDFSIPPPTGILAGMPPNFVVERYESDEFSFIGGAGIGWNINDLFRVDATWLTTNMYVTGTFFNPIIPGSFNAHMNSYFILANGYLDLSHLLLKTMHSLHFYINAGIGYANNEVEKVSGTAYISGAAGLSAVKFGLSNNTESDFAWRVGLEIAYNITRNFLFDVAYSYLDGGEYKTGSGILASGTGSLVTAPEADVHINMVTAGFMYLF